MYGCKKTISHPAINVGADTTREGFEEKKAEVPCIQLKTKKDAGVR